jgi:hypothetical protein
MSIILKVLFLTIIHQDGDGFFSKEIFPRHGLLSQIYVLFQLCNAGLFLLCDFLQELNTDCGIHFIY